MELAQGKAKFLIIHGSATFLNRPCLPLQLESTHIHYLSQTSLLQILAATGYGIETSTVALYIWRAYIFIDMQVQDIWIYRTVLSVCWCRKYWACE